PPYRRAARRDDHRRLRARAYRVRGGPAARAPGRPRRRRRRGGEPMNELVVLVVEDEPEVREALVRDLEPITGSVRVDAAGDVGDAGAAVEEIAAAGDVLGLVLADHRLPGRSGVDFLVSLAEDPGHRHVTRKVLVTGQAGHADTIRAVNDAGLDHYIAK